MTVTTDTPQVSRDTVQAITCHFDEPEWLCALRRHAWETYERLAWPTRHDETWRQVRPEAFRLEQCPPAQETRPRLRVTNAPSGLLVTTLAEAVAQHPALVQQYWMQQAIKPTNGKIQALHAAHVNGGVVIRVPRGTVVAQPLEIQWDYAQSDRAYFPHVLLIAEDESQVHVMDAYTQSAHGALVSVSGIEILAGRGSQVTYAVKQTLGHEARHLSFQRVMASRDAQVQLALLSTGSAISRFQVESVATEPGAHIQILGVRVGHGQQQCHVVSLQDHPGSRTVSDLLLKSALHESAVGTYYGMIKIHPHAQGCEAYQADRSLLLGEHAKAESTPILEIEANEVRCTHGASVGAVDEHQLFYMLARGIPHDVAQTMLVYGFLEGVVDRIKHPAVRASFTRDVITQVGALEFIEVTA